MATGPADGYWEACVTGLWDVLAGSFIVAAGGGIAEVYLDKEGGGTGAITTNGRIHEELKQVVADQFEGHELFETTSGD